MTPEDRVRELKREYMIFLSGVGAAPSVYRNRDSLRKTPGGWRTEHRLIGTGIP